MDLFCDTIRLRITSTDVLEIILRFRGELYIQELLEDCIHSLERYTQSYEDCTQLYHHYDMFIYQQFRTVLEYIDTSIYFQLTDLVCFFKKLGGPRHPEYIEIYQKYLQSKEKIDYLLSYDSFINCIDSVQRLHHCNQNYITRKLLTFEWIQSVQETLRKRLQSFEKGGETIRTQANDRLRVLQFIVHWLCAHSIDSWVFWFKSWFFTMEGFERSVYTTLKINQKAIRQFLMIHID